MSLKESWHSHASHSKSTIYLNPPPASGSQVLYSDESFILQTSIIQVHQKLLNELTSRSQVHRISDDTSLSQILCSAYINNHYSAKLHYCTKSVVSQLKSTVALILQFYWLLNMTTCPFHLLN
jgi:hypothetical protein